MTDISRNADKCSTAAVAIKIEAGNPVEYIQANLSLLAGIQQDAPNFLQFHQQLQILVNNARGFFIKRTVTSDGFESTFSLNHLNYYLLATHLFDKLKARAPARVINIASDPHGAQELFLKTCKGNNGMGDSESTVNPTLPMFYLYTTSPTCLKARG